MSFRNQLVLTTLLSVALAPAALAGRRENEAMEATRAGDHQRAAEIWVSLAKKGDANAQFRAGSLFMHGQGIRKDVEEGVSWYRMAAEAGLPQARTQLALVYLSGRGNPEEDPNAESLMLETARTAPGKTKYDMGKAYLSGMGVEPDAQAALDWFQRAGEGWGRSDAREMVSRMRDEGLLYRAAEIGYADAQLFLGDLYANGDGVPKSLEEAAKWHFLAANQGHTEAQMTLAWYFGRGIGLTKDAAESARWFRKAAESGHVKGQYQLGLMLRDGVGVAADRVEAHMWFNLAAAKGDELARTARDELIKRMTPGQKTEAEARAVAWWLERQSETEE